MRFAAADPGIPPVGAGPFVLSTAGLGAGTTHPAEARGGVSGEGGEGGKGEEGEEEGEEEATTVMLVASDLLLKAQEAAGGVGELLQESEALEVLDKF